MNYNKFYIVKNKNKYICKNIKFKFQKITNVLDL